MLKLLLWEHLLFFFFYPQRFCQNHSTRFLCSLPFQCPKSRNIHTQVGLNSTDLMSKYCMCIITLTTSPVAIHALFMINHEFLNLVSDLFCVTCVHITCAHIMVSCIYSACACIKNPQVMWLTRPWSAHYQISTYTQSALSTVKLKELEMDAAPSSPKRPKLDNGAGDAYIPTQEHTDGEPTFAVIFSLQEEKGALARALKPFEVRGTSWFWWDKDCVDLCRYYGWGSQV